MSEEGRRTRRVLNDAAGSPSVAARKPHATRGAWTTAIIALAGVVEIAWLGVLTWTAMELTR